MLIIYECPEAPPNTHPFYLIVSSRSGEGRFVESSGQSLERYKELLQSSNRRYPINS